MKAYFNITKKSEIFKEDFNYESYINQLLERFINKKNFSPREIKFVLRSIYNDYLNNENGIDRFLYFVIQSKRYIKHAINSMEWKYESKISKNWINNYTIVPEWNYVNNENYPEFIYKIFEHIYKNKKENLTLENRITVELYNNNWENDLIKISNLKLLIPKYYLF